MAGLWIKVEHELPDKPEVFRIADRLGIDPDAVVGKLIRFWRWCDLQAVSGTNLGITKDTIDRLVHLPGFSAALLEVDWLQAQRRSDGESLAVPRFDRHNGQTAKARAESARRMSLSRNRNGCCENTATSAQQPANQSQRESKNKKEGRPPPAGERSGEASAPISEALAVQHGPALGVSPEAARAWWLDSDGRGWLDGKGHPILNWKSAMRSYGVKWQEIEAKQAARNGGNRPARKPEPIRGQSKPEELLDF